MQLNLINTLSQPLKMTAQFVFHQEKPSGLSTSRFVQDTGTCLLPKAAFSRSKADFAENTFLELTEGAAVYFGPALLGEKITRKIFSKGLNKEEAKMVALSTKELLEQKASKSVKKVVATKSAIALVALAIPLCVFTINYFKNLFTLKLFKQGDFNNIANLENKKESSEHQEKVRESAKKNIKIATFAFLVALTTAFVTVKKGQSSKTLQSLNEFILAPGNKLFKKNEQAKAFMNKYFSLDFAQENGKLVLSRGQLTSCVVIGGIGYFGAAKDRGKQNFLETLFRYPIIGLYVITGSELFEKCFRKFLYKNGKCKEMIDKNLNTPKFTDIEAIAKKQALQNKTDIRSEFKKLVKQKVFISGVPYLFSIIVMGFFVIGVSNFFTKYRFNNKKN